MLLSPFAHTRHRPLGAHMRLGTQMRLGAIVASDMFFDKSGRKAPANERSFL